MCRLRQWAHSRHTTDLSYNRHWACFAPGSTARHPFFLKQQTVGDVPPWGTWLNQEGESRRRKNKKKKAQHPAGFEPTTSRLLGVCSTTVLQLHLTFGGAVVSILFRGKYLRRDVPKGVDGCFWVPHFDLVGLVEDEESLHGLQGDVRHRRLVHQWHQTVDQLERGGLDFVAGFALNNK